METTNKLELFFREQGYILCVDKPYEWSSFDVVKKIKSILKFKCDIPKPKVGHAGTLDPLATGVLIVCIGKATKKIESIQEMEKTYTGEFTLGAITPSYDREHPVSETFPTEHITDSLIKETASTFIGEQLQTPPVYSAVKVGGKRAYKFARKDQEVKLNPKQVHIYDFETGELKDSMVEFKIKCSKGTYIRSIARDFGEKINSGAYLNSLRRTEIGKYSITEAANIENLESLFEELKLQVQD